ncbi:MAG: helix-turn-helix domain-containing protein [Campylobacterota bacterium]|nr:helix-turn-helix domain-containing protein [Campylobacterota bacterium]
MITALKDGYTQAKIAKFIGVSRSLICKILKGNGVYSTPP